MSILTTRAINSENMVGQGKLSKIPFFPAAKCIKRGARTKEQRFSVGYVVLKPVIFPNLGVFTPKKRPLALTVGYEIAPKRRPGGSRVKEGKICVVKHSFGGR